MNVVSILDYLRNRSEMLKKAFYVFLVILVIFDFLLSREHAHYIVDKIYAFWTIFSIIGCFALIKVAKGLAHTILGKDEDFYE